MADTKITALTALTGADPANDVIPIVDVSDTTMAASGTTKKISVNNILGASGTATLASATITGDLTVDTSTLKVDSANNRVGIGTASPGSALDVYGETRVRSGNQLRVYRADNAIYSSIEDAGSGVGLSLNNANGDGFLLKVASNNVYQVSSSYVQTWYDGAGGTRMTLNSSGLGVGTSPSFTLDIAAASPRIRQTATTGTNSCHLMLVNTGGTAYVGLDNSTSGLTAAYALNLYHSGAYPICFSTNSTERMRIDSSGNVGIGVTPSAWGSTYRALQIGIGTSLTGVTNDVDVNLVNNARFDGTNWKYTNSSPAERYRAASGTHYWYNAASGTAGNNITWTQAMTLESTGSLVLGAAAVATTATNGFLYIPGCAGTPTGTPTAKTGRVPLVVDTTNNKLYFYSGGAWVAAN